MKRETDQHEELTWISRPFLFSEHCRLHDPIILRSSTSTHYAQTLGISASGRKGKMTACSMMGADTSRALEDLMVLFTSFGGFSAVSEQTEQEPHILEL